MAGAFGLTPSVTPDTDPDKNYNNRVSKYFVRDYSG